MSVLLWNWGNGDGKIASDGLGSVFCEAKSTLGIS